MKLKTRKMFMDFAVNNDVNKNHGYKNIMNETNHAYKIT